MRQIKVSDINIDSRLQSRVHVREEVVLEYAELFEEKKGWPFNDPVSLVEVDGKLYVVDGFTRMAAAISKGIEKVSAIVTKGTWNDAVTQAVGANSAHGQRRTNADKKKAVSMAIAAFPKLGCHRIASLAGVSKSFAWTIHNELNSSEPKAPKEPKKKTGPKPKNNPKPASESESNVIKADRSDDIVEGVPCVLCNCPKWLLTDGGRVCDACGAHEDVAQLPLPDDDSIKTQPKKSIQRTADKELIKQAKVALGKLIRSTDKLGHNDYFGPKLEELAAMYATIEEE